MNNFLLSFFLLLSGFAMQVQAQVAKTQVVRAGARANTDGTITLYWPQEAYTGTWQIYRRNTQQSDDWGSVVATVPGNQSSWTDISVNPGGEAPEYLISKVNTSNQAEAIGYVYAGNNIPEVLDMGGLILLLDSSYLTALRSEIDRLVNQLRSEGWKVSRLAAGRKESPAAVSRSRTPMPARRHRAMPSPICVPVSNVASARSISRALSASTISSTINMSARSSSATATGASTNPPRDVTGWPASAPATASEVCILPPSPAACRVFYCFVVLRYGSWLEQFDK